MQVPAAPAGRRWSRARPKPPPRKGSDDHKMEPVTVVKKHGVPPPGPSVSRSPSSGGSHMVEAMVQIIPKPPHEDAAHPGGPPPLPSDLSSSPPRQLKKSTTAPSIIATSGGGGAFGGFDPSKVKLKSTGKRRATVKPIRKTDASEDTRPPWMKERDAKKKQHQSPSKPPDAPKAASSAAAGVPPPPAPPIASAASSSEVTRIDSLPEVQSRMTAVSVPEDNGLGAFVAEEVARESEAAATAAAAARAAEEAAAESRGVSPSVVPPPFVAKSAAIVQVSSPRSTAAAGTAGIGESGGTLTKSTTTKRRTPKPSSKMMGSSAASSVISEHEEQGSEKEILLREISYLERQFGAKDDALKEITRQDVMHLLEEMEPIDVLLAMQDFMSNSDDLDALRVLNLALSDV